VAKPRHRAFVDESSVIHDSKQEYRICAVLVPFEKETELREAVKSFLSKGQMKFHWTQEDRRRRQRFTDFISRLNLVCLVVTHSDDRRRNDERYRRKCFEHLYHELVTHDVSTLAIEARSKAQNLLDIEHIVGLRGRGLYSNLYLTHIAGKEEPLLWMADAILGVVNAAVVGDESYAQKFSPTALRLMSTSL
jgi:hypothetical protein